MPSHSERNILITLTRQLARQVHDVFSRTLPKPTSRSPQPVVLETGPGGLSIRSWSLAAAVEFHEASKLEAETLTIPLDAFKSYAGSRPEPVTVEKTDSNQAVLRWNDRGIPQVASFDVPEANGEFPSVPERLSKAGESFLSAVRDAIDTTDNGSSRYAINCVRLWGAGSIEATDTRQALVQSGFKIPWSGGLLVPANPVFKSAVFSDDCEVRIGQSENWVAFRIGPWTIQLALEKEKRFPDIKGCLPLASATTTRLRISDADARFLVQSLSRLPHNETSNGAVTVDLNGAVAVRARSADCPTPTELLLTGSTRLGDEVCLATDRKFLERAVRLGFRELCFVEENAPVVCRDGQREYFWALLDKSGIVKPAPDAVRIESMNGQNSKVVEPAADPQPAGGPRRRSARSLTAIEEAADARPVQEPEPLPTGGSEPELAKQADPPDRPTIEQALHLRDELRTALKQTRQLISCIRGDRKRSRLATR
jgi:hypothetical protein